MGRLCVCVCVLTMALIHSPVTCRLAESVTLGREFVILGGVCHFGQQVCLPCWVEGYKQLCKSLMFYCTCMKLWPINATMYTLVGITAHVYVYAQSVTVH